MPRNYGSGDVYIHYIEWREGIYSWDHGAAVPESNRKEINNIVSKEIANGNLSAERWAAGLPYYKAWQKFSEKYGPVPEGMYYVYQY